MQIATDWTIQDIRKRSLVPFSKTCVERSKTRLKQVRGQSKERRDTKCLSSWIRCTSSTRNTSSTGSTSNTSSTSSTGSTSSTCGTTSTTRRTSSTSSTTRTSRATHFRAMVTLPCYCTNMKVNNVGNLFVKTRSDIPCLMAV